MDGRKVQPPCGKPDAALAFWTPICTRIRMDSYVVVAFGLEEAKC